MKFRKYQKIERYGRSGVYGINEGCCYVFPKLDGTNASVWLDNGEINAGSRNRRLTEEKDNAGFYRDIKENTKIRMFLEKYKGLRLYGEFLVPHTIKYYEDSAWRRFYVFDVVRELGNDEIEYLPYHEYKHLLEEFDIDYIKPLGEVTNGEYEDFVKFLDMNTFLTKDNALGEGIVIKNYNYTNRFGEVRWAKIVTDEFFKKHKKNKQIENAHILEEKIVNKYLTEAFIRKEASKIQNSHNSQTWESAFIPELLGRVWSEFLVEEMPEAIKDFKDPTINFRDLRKLMIVKTKEMANDLF